MSKRSRSAPPKPAASRFPLGLVFRSHRILRGETLEVVAPRAGLSAAELSRIERGLVPITPTLSARITAALVAPLERRLNLPQGHEASHP